MFEKLKKMFEKLKKKWNYFKGKKRNIGIVLLALLEGITLVSPDLVPLEYQAFLSKYISLFLVGGALDAYRRSESGKQKIDKAIIKSKEVYSKAKEVIKY
jgi:hypothetical protein